MLIRALEPVFGINLMERRRKTESLYNLCSGPGKICQALGIMRKEYGLDLCDANSPLYLRSFRSVPKSKIASSPRINVAYAEEAKDWPWRFFIKGNPFVSV